MKTNISIRTEKDIKQQAQRLFADLGMDMSTAINLFLIQAVQHQGLPFDITLKRPNAATMKAITSKEMNGPFNSVSQLMNSLDA